LQKALADQAQEAIKKGAADGTAKRYLEHQAARRPVPPAPRTQITLLDKQGKQVGTVGDPGLYAQAALSPDGNRIAVIRTDPQTRTTDVWVYDVATGKGTPITSDATPNITPVWSPDGKQIAYVGVFPTESYSAIYRKAADGSGQEELLYKHTPGAPAYITDWSVKGQLCFWSGDAIYGLPLDGDRKPSALVGGKFPARGGRYSPDGRLLAYSANMSGRFETYILPLDNPNAQPLQVSKTQPSANLLAQGQQGTLLLNLVGLVPNALMAADLTIAPELQVGAPRMLYRLAGVTSPAQVSNIASGDGERFVFLPPAPVSPPR
jgi:Tol biopolymer transport system component